MTRTPNKTDIAHRSPGSDEPDFDEVVSRAYARLPDWIRARVDNVAITVEDFVDHETVSRMGLDDYMSLLGLYHGVPRTERTVGAGFELPDKIVLYRMPILEEALDTQKSVEDVVYETLWHEIAHHFGLGEDDVRRREGEEFSGPDGPSDAADGR